MVFIIKKVRSTTLSLSPFFPPLLLFFLSLPYPGQSFMAHQLIAPLGGGVQPRLEINTFVQDDRFFSLYVQALSTLLFFSYIIHGYNTDMIHIAAMQNTDQNELPSWFQVAGIHGYPFIAYDSANGVNGFHANPQQQAAGYCTHGSTLFPTWHRPYMMLVEVRVPVF